MSGVAFWPAKSVHSPSCPFSNFDLHGNAIQENWFLRNRVQINFEILNHLKRYQNFVVNVLEDIIQNQNIMKYIKAE
jgi:hypothetical protein